MAALLDRGFDLSAKDEIGYTAMDYLLERGYSNAREVDLDSLRLLISARVPYIPPTPFGSNIVKTTPLILAAHLEPAPVSWP